MLSTAVVRLQPRAALRPLVARLSSSGDGDEPLSRYWKDFERRVSLRTPRRDGPSGRGPRRKEAEDYWLEAGAYDAPPPPPRAPAADLRVDAVVVGAGAVGLAVTRALATRGVDVVCVERAPRHGEAMSARSSEVVHAGLYYGAATPRKRRCCVAGRRALYAYLEAKDIPHRRCGKLVVAASAAQVAGLERLEALARAAGVDDVARLDAAAAREMEPEVACVAALHSPSTGIFDSAAYADALRADCDALGAAVVANHDVAGFRDGVVELRVGGDVVSIRADVGVVNCAGLEAGALAATLGTPAAYIPETRLAKGSYFALRAARAPFSRLVYPLPDAGGLGVHYTVDLAGRARFGPDVEWLPAGADAADPTLFAVDAERAAPFYDAVRAYWPGLPDGALAPDYAGVRPKVAGTAVADFGLLRDGPRLHVLGVESPGLTASLALADEVADALLATPAPGGPAWV